MEQKSNLPVPKKRPLLIFNHNAKAGGGSILKVLTDSKPCKTSMDEYEKLLKGEDESWKDCFIEVKEGSHTGYIDRQNGFIIGSVREPCDYYVSWFTFTSSEYGYLWTYSKKHPDLAELLGNDPPFFNSTRDVKSFHTFLKYHKLLGRAHKHIEMSYIDDNRLEVDCWVFVDDFQVSLVKCLRQYEAQGGDINWDTPLISELMESADKQSSKRLLGEKTKNNPINNPQLLHHAPCQSYFDDETASMIEEEDKMLYTVFGYEGCCKGRRFKDKLLGPNKPVLTSNASFIMLTSVMLALIASLFWVRSPVKKTTEIIHEVEELVSLKEETKG